VPTSEAIQTLGARGSHGAPRQDGHLGLDAFGTATEDSPDGHRKSGCSVQVFETFRQRSSSRYEPWMQILFLRHRRTWRSSQRRRNTNDFSANERVRRVVHYLVRWSDTACDLDTGPEIAADFDVAQFDRVIRLENADL
jgi:hypothetical protein